MPPLTSAGPAPSAPLSACSPIPVSAANAPAVGATASSPSSWTGELPEMILPADAATRGRGDAATESRGAAPEGATAPETQPPAPGPRPPAPPSRRPLAALARSPPPPPTAVDWQRGNYTVVTRGGRIESPVRSGELKKQLRMVSEGSVLVGGDALRGARSGRGAGRLPAPGLPRRLRPLHSRPRAGDAMRYRLTCLTPLLVGDGRKLSPIDYMVWKDQVNVLDQRRIFRLLAKGPRLDGYLTQLKRADKLDFASWGGFAQNFADRRIPFESPAYSAYLEPRRRRQPAHPDLRRRRLRTVPARRRHQGRAAHRHAVRQLERRACCKEVAATMQGDRLPRRPAESRGRPGARAPPAACRMRFVGARRFRRRSPTRSFKLYLLRVSTLQPRGGGVRAGLEAEPARRRGRRAAR